MYKFLHRALALMLLCFLMVSTTSCKDEPTDLSTNLTTVELKSTQNCSQAVTIKCNKAWDIYDIPEWLSVSARSGNGDATITFTSRTANESSQTRTAEVKIVSEKKTAILTVIQEAGLMGLFARPSNITTLWFGVAFDLEFSPGVGTVKMQMLSDNEMKHMTEQEIITSIMGQEPQIPEDETLYTRGCSYQNTKYHILTIAFDTKGNRGELVDVDFIIPAEKNARDDAWCSFENAGYDDELFAFSVVKEGRCATYNLIYGANINPRYFSELMMAFEINYYINNNKKHWLAQNWDLQIEINYPNNHTFYAPYSTSYYYGGVLAAAWGIFNDGTLSSDICMICSDTYATEEAPNKFEAPYKKTELNSGFVKYTPTKKEKK